MVTRIDSNKKLTRLFQIALATIFAVILLFFFLQSQAKAAVRFVGGAYGCGAINTSIVNTPENKTMTPMVPERASNGAVISKNIVIQGGWNYFGDQTSNCAGVGANFGVTNTQSMRDTGFVFQAPITRSALTNDGIYSILTISPTVSQVAIEHMSFNNQQFALASANGTLGLVSKGGAIKGMLDNGAVMRLTNVLISDTMAIDNGGGLYLELRGGSHLLIEGSEFMNNLAQSGGGFEIRVYDNSQVTIMNSLFDNNDAFVGGAGKIVIEDGTVNILNSTFSNNGKNGGGALSVQGLGGKGIVNLINSTFINNTGQNIAVSGSGVNVYNMDKSVALPLVLNDYPPTNEQVRITGITLNSNYNYDVEFETYNFTPSLPGTHLHFYFNTVAPTDAGSGGAGPWKIHGSANNFTAYGDWDRPAFATEMCVLVANGNHTVRQNTGNCYRLPVNR